MLLLIDAASPPRESSTRCPSAAAFSSDRLNVKDAGSAAVSLPRRQASTSTRPSTSTGRSTAALVSPLPRAAESISRSASVVSSGASCSEAAASSSSASRSSDSTCGGREIFDAPPPSSVRMMLADGSSEDINPARLGALPTANVQGWMRSRSPSTSGSSAASPIRTPLRKVPHRLLASATCQWSSPRRKRQWMRDTVSTSAGSFKSQESCRPRVSCARAASASSGAVRGASGSAPPSPGRRRERGR